jgi:hypothetical protein
LEKGGLMMSMNCLDLILLNPPQGPGWGITFDDLLIEAGIHHQSFDDRLYFTLGDDRVTITNVMYNLYKAHYEMYGTMSFDYEGLIKTELAKFSPVFLAESTDFSWFDHPDWEGLPPVESKIANDGEYSDRVEADLYELLEKGQFCEGTIKKVTRSRLEEITKAILNSKA